MNTKEIFILLPDGVGLRNFAFTSFVQIGEEMGWNITFWNFTPFNLTQLGFSEITQTPRPRPVTDLLKRAKINAELDYFSSIFQDPVYHTYRFRSSNKGVKNKTKNLLVSALSKKYKGKQGLNRVRKKLRNSERKGGFYLDCIKVLKAKRPDLVFCTNQRAITAIAPLTAAHDLNIRTSTFIFSWDNLPKATMVVETDYYFVWSDHMKKELIQYYPQISQEQIKVTGSPQFEPHFDTSLRIDKERFFSENGLDPKKDYICFSGDDITTSPHDPQYLEDFAQVIRAMNGLNHKLGIIFRRSPVDFSERYLEVLNQYQDVIVPIDPLWKKVGDGWNTALPTKEDLRQQINTIFHSKLVVNIASSMVFDFSILGKPCLYLNYMFEGEPKEPWNPQKIYDFVHFRSMPSKQAVIWINSEKEIQKKLILALEKQEDNVEEAQKWFRIINMQPPQEASRRIWKAMEEIALGNFSTP